MNLLLDAVLLLFLSINDVKALLFLSVIAGRMSIKNLISWSLAVFLPLYQPKSPTRLQHWKQANCFSLYWLQRINKEKAL